MSWIRDQFEAERGKRGEKGREGNRTEEKVEGENTRPPRSKILVTALAYIYASD